MTMQHASDNANGADVAIIGAGPIGIELAAGLRQGGARVVHLEAGSIGATMQWWAPGTRYFSSPERIEIAGVPLITPNQDKATREEYMAYLRGVMRQFALPIHTFTRVVNVERDGDGFVLNTVPSRRGVGGPAELTDHRTPEATGENLPVTRFRAKNIVLAIGNMHMPRMIDVPGEDLPHVSHYLADPHMYYDRRVVIVGGKNSAVEAAIRLYRVGAHVTMSYRGEQFDTRRVKYWLRPELEWLIDKGWVGFHPRTVVCRIGHDAIELADIDDPSKRSRVDADNVLLLTGYMQCGDLFDQLGVERRGETRAPVFDTETMRTNVEGVYVAGTAAGGSQTRARLFIENSHVHVERIVRTLIGATVPWATAPEYASLEES